MGTKSDHLRNIFKILIFLRVAKDPTTKGIKDGEKKNRKIQIQIFLLCATRMIINMHVDFYGTVNEKQREVCQFIVSSNLPTTKSVSLV